EQVKLGGRRIELGEVDAALQALPGVAGGAAAVKETAGGMQLLIGYLAPEAAGDDRRDAWTEALRESLPPALVPRLVLVDDLPTKTSGKVDRAALPWPLPGQETAETGPDDLPAHAQWCAEQWQAVLGTRPTMDSDFFDSGGGSLAAAQLVSRLRAQHPSVTVGDVYAAPRFGALVALAVDADEAAPARPRRTITRTRYSMQTLQTLLGIPVHVLAAMRWVVLALVLVNVAGAAGADVPTVSWWLILVLVAVFVTPWGRMLISAGVARLLLSGVRPGASPRSGSVHLPPWPRARSWAPGRPCCRSRTWGPRPSPSPAPPSTGACARDRCTPGPRPPASAAPGTSSPIPRPPACGRRSCSTRSARCCPRRSPWSPRSPVSPCWWRCPARRRSSARSRC